VSTKDDIRSRHRARRTALTQADLEAAGAALAGHGVVWASAVAADGGHGTFAAYLGVGSEPPTLPLLAALHDAGHRVLLPVCEPELTLSWVYWIPGSGLTRSRYAPIQEPVGERLDTSVMLSATGIFLPATALDRSGNRIGQGGGYYDKFLTALAGLPWGKPAAETGPLPTAALVYDAEILPAGSIPAESFDRRVAAALTPGGLVQLSGRP
jgi:5-formyltetrahydrofolate cyclo-ligase